MGDIKTTVDFSPDLLSNGQKIIIYGASIYGEIALRLLEKAGLRPDYYCDRIVNGYFFDIPIIEPEYLSEYRDDWVIIASADYFHELTTNAIEIGCTHIGNLSKLFIDYPIDIAGLSNRAVGYYVNKQNYIDVANQQVSDDILNFTRVQFVVSEKCSLKCKDCLHLMQYYKHPSDIDLYGCKESFERLLNIAENISEIRILGGEPFINPEMYRIIEWWHDNPRIHIFRIYTNGTIVPKDKTLEYLKFPKVDVYISDYGINKDRIDKLTERFDNLGIKYYVSPYDGWADAGDIHFRHHSEKENIEIFGRCHARNCISFVDGRLYRCPRSAHLNRLGIMPDKDDEFVDIKCFDGSDNELKKRIIRLQKREWIEACNYCDGADLHVPQIPAGIQTVDTLYV